MDLTTSFKVCVFNKYADFKGKAVRSEYWWFWLIYVLGVLGLPLIAFLLSDIFSVELYSLLFLWFVAAIGLTCPFIAVSIRRLHDAGLSGWHALWRIVPYAGSIITIVLMCRKSMSTTQNRLDVHCHKSSNLSGEHNKAKALLKHVGISLTVAVFCGLGMGSMYYIPIFVLLFLYYQYLIWRRKKVKVEDILMLPILQRIGLYKNINDSYVLKRKLLVFAAILVGTIFIAFCTFYLNEQNYEYEYDGIITTLLIFDILAWVIFFFYEYGTQWLNNNKSIKNTQENNDFTRG